MDLDTAVAMSATQSIRNLELGAAGGAIAVTPPPTPETAETGKSIPNHDKQDSVS